MDCVFFFFQAEDGIRDLVRSRGLGDVYKRQELIVDVAARHAAGRIVSVLEGGYDLDALARSVDAVSYTHLTLPTSDLV